MKILRIKLNNLNSLRGEHEVNFETEPLASAGLFTITGPTGAGKSTLLDAITLALYGRAARYTNVANPEDMISRHCGECRAEVEFVVASGRFRAEWILRRARGKPEGNLQMPHRRVYGGQGEVLAQSIRESESLIEQLVGLDYPRFLRSVLLAQGEFARFLTTNPDERAELLECLTGTAIYSELGELAHRETSRRETSLQGREALLGQVVLLTNAERLDQEKQAGELETALIRQREHIVRLNAAFAQAGELRNALASEAGLLRDQQRLETRKQSGASDLARLARHRLTAEFAVDLNRFDAAQERVSEQAAVRSSTEQQEQEARRRWIVTMSAALDFAQTLVANGERSLAAVEQVRKNLEVETQGHSAWLAEHSVDGELEARRADFLSELQRLKSLRDELAKAGAKSLKLAVQIKAQEVRVAAAEIAAKEATANLKGCELGKAAAARELEVRLAGRTEAVREAECTALRLKVQVLSDSLSLLDACDQMQRNIARDQMRLDEFSPKIAAALAQSREAASALEASNQNLSLHQDHLHKSELLNSLAAHRSVLKAGEACPLCGALEHPLAGSELQTVSFVTLKGAVRKAEREAAKASEAARLAEKTVTSLQGEQTSLEKTVAALRVDLTEFRERFETRSRSAGIEIGGRDELIAARDLSESHGNRFREELVQIRKAASILAGFETERLKAEHRVNAARQSQVNEENALTATRTEQKENEDAVVECQDKLESGFDLLRDLLKHFQITFPDSGQEHLTRNSLEQRHAAYQEHVRGFNQASSALEKSKITAENSSKSLALWKQAAAGFAEAVALQGAKIDPASRSEKEALQSRWGSLDDASQAVRESGNDFTMAAVTSRERKDDHLRGVEQVERMTVELGKKLAGTTFASVEMLRASRLNDVQAVQLEQLDRELRSETDRLSGRLDAVQRMITDLRAAKVAEGETATLLETELGAAQKLGDELLMRASRLRDSLQRDQENRLQHATKAAELEAERKRLQVWKHLQSLIGSHDGRKFRRYAQTISLDILNHHANKHLRRLSDRYRTHRRAGEGLELEIEDLYQAGVTRPMASLSGGESFLVSLALALGLADLAGRNVRIDSLFIDEGFGPLDSDSLDVAISALESLRQNNKTVGVISHVELLKERISTQIIVEKKPGGTSSLRVVS